TTDQRAFWLRMVKHSDVALAGAVVMVLVVLIIPMPPPLLDVLLTINISASLAVLLVTLNASESLEFSTFPSMLLFATLFRLALNVASTRLILLHAYAGEVITSFGNFVVGGNIVVGMIVFLILVVIQFVVITKGSGRISEVAARFTLDAMPGKQMAIDADLNAGLITEDVARKRREKIAREADFYGAMDGASKFVRGDAVAGIIITVINIVGGIIIGAMNGMGVGQAVNTYAILTVGDGLVTQIPSLIIATASGILITKASSKTNLSREMTAQLFTQPRPLLIASAILVFFGLIPGLPKIPFFVMSLVFGGLYYASKRLPALQKAKQEAAQAAAQAKPAPASPDDPDGVRELLELDRIGIEVGYRLIPMVAPAGGGGLLDKIAAIRKRLAKSLGFVIPAVRIKDNVQLEPDAYRILLRGEQVAAGKLAVDHLLAMDGGTVIEKIAGVPTTEPAFGLKALWIDRSQKDLAEMNGYTVIDPVTVLVTHLSEIIKRHAHEILCREDVHKLVDIVKKENPTIVDELVPNMLPLSTVQRVLANLLQEKVPIVDLAAILEALANHAHATKDPEVLTEFVRQSMARTICSRYAGQTNTLQAIAFDPALEQALMQSVSREAIEPGLAQKIVKDVSDAVRAAVASGKDAVLLTSSLVRRHVRNLLAAVLPDLPVIAYNEIPPSFQIVPVATVGEEKKEKR
ncbi:MAG TPA: flagellar biosynthesis protein FlhA, partial [Planctomycetota bacterium]|nr:flagellar biosynthesis protein FlhA [Planctomycetota bacterium]